MSKKYGRVRVFFCEPVGDMVVYEGYACNECGEHFDVDVGRFHRSERPVFPAGKEAACPKCGKMASLWSQSCAWIYRRGDNGEEVGGKAKLPAGAMYYLPDAEGYAKGPDGHSLVVVLPNGHQWHVDMRCSNCTMPNDNKHRCWVRHGDVRKGEITVDKNGRTCSAGAGSIQSGDYHGFLRDNHLVDA